MTQQLEGICAPAQQRVGEPAASLHRSTNLWQDVFLRRRRRRGGGGGDGGGGSVAANGLITASTIKTSLSQRSASDDAAVWISWQSTGGAAQLLSPGGKKRPGYKYPNSLLNISVSWLCCSRRSHSYWFMFKVKWGHRGKLFSLIFLDFLMKL